MLELFETLSVQQVVIYLIMLAFAGKGAVEFGNWTVEQYKKRFDKDYTKKKTEEELSEHLTECSLQREQTLQQYQSLNEKLDQMTEAINKKIGELESQLKQLTESDKHDIKGWIVEKHHQLMKRGWVDDFTMDTLEYRYSDYVAEDGNSYVADLMIELRSLPHFPPKEN